MLIASSGVAALGRCLRAWEGAEVILRAACLDLKSRGRWYGVLKYWASPILSSHMAIIELS